MEGASTMWAISPTVINFASPEYHSLYEDVEITACDNRHMSDESKNGGPNFLKAWRVYREMTQQELAEAVGTSQHQIAYLESGERPLSAKWLRKLSGPLDTTPGMLLDHDPTQLSADIVDIWATASTRQKQQLVELARVVVKDKTGTDD
jgi:transcriptional regulator with XRE-family HTH domain